MRGYEHEPAVLWVARRVAIIGTGGASEERFSLVVGASASGSSYVLGPARS